MIEMIRQVPGPLFLLYYLCYAVLCALIGRLWIRSDSSLNYPAPDLTRLDPISLSYIRGGLSGVIRTAVFDLWSRGLVTIGGTGADVTLTQYAVGRSEAAAKMKGLKPVVHAIYNFLAVKRKSAELFRSEELKQTLDAHLQFVVRELTQFRLLKTEGDQTRSALVAVVVLVVMLIPGLTKLCLGIARGKPVSFLFVLLIVSVIGLGIALKPWSKVSGLGKKYLAALMRDFAWVKEKAKRKGHLTGIDPAFAVAVFGPAVLGGWTGYSAFNSVFHKSSGSACGGCSGASSGCGGGSSCGGGGCGGGCGGCGG